MKIQSANENSLILYFSTEADPEVTQRIAHFLRRAQDEFGSALIDWVASYISLLLVFDEQDFEYERDHDRLLSLFEQTEGYTIDEGALHNIVVCYHPELAPDLEPLSNTLGLSVDDIIDIHCGREYLVYAIGFLPDFAFLGSVDARIAHPRQNTPRSSVAAGSLGIADTQTGIYPRTSPGGWQIIGRQPHFACGERPFSGALSVGDRVRFNPISLNDYRKYAL